MATEHLNANRKGCKLDVALYNDIKKTWPSRGHHILAHYDDETVVVYQAYNPKIAAYAVEHKKFIGCDSFSPTRMTWIKTNFLWMQFRSDWNRKQNQERTLAIWLKREAFEEILKLATEAKAVLQKESTEQLPRKKKGKKTRRAGEEPHYEETKSEEIDDGEAKEAKETVEKVDEKEEGEQEENPKKKGQQKPKLVRLQWDPDHTPEGNKVPFRRAIQLGLRGLREYIDGTWIVDIQDITPFVIEQSSRTGQPRKDLLVPSERVYHPTDPSIAPRIRLSDDYEATGDADDHL